MGDFDIFSRVRNLWRDCAGNLALSFALLSPILFGLMGGAVDLIVYERQQAQMQDAADAAALAAAREASLKGWNAETAEAVVASMINGNLEGKTFSQETEFQTLVSVDEPNRTVHVTLDMDQYSFFVLSYFRNDPQIRVTSSATSSGETNICMVGLDESASTTVGVSGKALVNAAECAVYSNSSAMDGLVSIDKGLLSAQFSCSVGGYAGASSNYSRRPTTDCPVMADPLTERIPPVAGACDYTNLVLDKQIIVLDPGTYCGGIYIDHESDVTFKPGTYVIKDGELRSKNNAISRGVGVSFYFTGPGSRFVFDGTTIIDFVAPSSGPMAGVLFFQDPASPAGTVFEIASKKASNLLGTIYLPNATLSVQAKNKIAEASAYTVIVAKRIDIGNETQMYVNANYDLTPVPVPPGLGPQPGRIRLLN